MRCLVWGNQLDYEVTEQDPEGDCGPAASPSRPNRPDYHQRQGHRGRTQHAPAHPERGGRRSGDARHPGRTAEIARREARAAGRTAVWQRGAALARGGGAHEVVIPFAPDTRRPVSRRNSSAPGATSPNSSASSRPAPSCISGNASGTSRTASSPARTTTSIVFDLAARIWGRRHGGVTPAVRETVATVAELTKGKGATVSQHAVATVLNLKQGGSERAGEQSA